MLVVFVFSMVQLHSWKNSASTYCYTSLSVNLSLRFPTTNWRVLLEIWVDFKKINFNVWFEIMKLGLGLKSRFTEMQKSSLSWNLGHGLTAHFWKDRTSSFQYNYFPLRLLLNSTSSAISDYALNSTARWLDEGYDQYQVWNQEATDRG